MKPTYIAIVLVGIGLALGIVYLVRRDHIYIRQALFWLAVAGVSFVLAVFPPSSTPSAGSSASRTRPRSCCSRRSSCLS